MSVKTIFDTLEQVSKTSGRNDKIALIDRLVSNPGDKALLSEILLYTRNPFWTYRLTMPVVVTKVLHLEFQQRADEDSNEVWTIVKGALDSLKSRQVELRDGRNMLQGAISSIHPVYQIWFTRIVNRDLKCGIQDWNRWFLNLIPKVSPMLCDTWNPEDGVRNAYIEPKYDGQRVLIIVDHNGDCTGISRNGKEHYNLETVFSEIKSLGIKNMVLDGEGWAGTRGETGSILRSQSLHRNQDKLIFYPFDILLIDEWTKGYSMVPLSERKGLLAGMIPSMPHVIKAPAPLIQSMEEMRVHFNEYLSAGYEGAVMKDPESPYFADDKRRPVWQKVKPTETADLVVYDVQEGRGRHEGRLGALKVRGTVKYNGTLYEIDTEVGTGLTDEDRDRLWLEYTNGTLNGTVVEVKFQSPSALNLSNDGNRNVPSSLDFPVFMGVRDDK